MIQITYMPDSFHDGWDSLYHPCGGTVTGHWLSAAAQLNQVRESLVLKARADGIVKKIGECQKENGNGWCFSHS